MISPSFLVRRLASLSPEKKSTKARLLSLQRNATDAFIDGGSSTGAAFASSAAIGSGAVVVTVSAFCWQPASARIAASSEEHTSELQSLMRISYAVFCLTKKT